METEIRAERCEGSAEIGTVYLNDEGGYSLYCPSCDRSWVVSTPPWYRPTAKVKAHAEVVLV